MIIIETINELAEDYKETCIKLQNKIKRLKKELNDLYDNGIYIGKETLLIRKQLVILEDILYQTRGTYNHLKHYYDIKEEENV